MGWMREHYPEMTSIHELADDYAGEFGWRPTPRALYVVAHRNGIHKRPVANHDGRAERVVRWSMEPEMEAWMLEHDHGERSDTISNEFRAKFGFGLSRAQITLFRQTHGTTVRRKRGDRSGERPVGSEYVSKGTTYVKVAECPQVPGTKDNWRPKQVVVWEEANGRPFPEGHNCYFADGDRRNYDPENLVPVPKRLIGLLHHQNAPKWHDRESLRACVALAELRLAKSVAQAEREYTCPLCGATFHQPEWARRGGKPVRTCPDCLAAGRRATWEGRRDGRFDHDEMRAAYDAGASYREVSERFGCSYALAWKVCSRQPGYED